MNTISAHPCHTFRDAAEVQPSCEQYRHLKLSVRRQLAAEFQDSMPVVLIRRAVDEAELLALSTDFPHLFLPELAREQVDRISLSLRGGAVFPDSAHIAATAA